MRAFNFLQEKAEQEGTGFIAFKDERDELGNLRGISKRSLSRKKQSMHIYDRTSQNTSKTSQRNKKVRFLKEIYSTHGNSEWCSLTHLRNLDKKFQLNIETEMIVQKPLVGLNQKLQFNDGIVRKFTANICNSPRLGKKNKTESFIPPIGYYHPQEILKRSPMLVFMDQQILSTHKLSQHKSSRTEASTAQPSIRPKLSPNKGSPVPQEILEKAFKTERIITEQKYKYVPQMIDERNLESTAARINYLRQKVLHQKKNSTSNQ